MCIGSALLVQCTVGSLRHSHKVPARSTTLSSGAHHRNPCDQRCSVRGMIVPALACLSWPHPHKSCSKHSYLTCEPRLHRLSRTLNRTKARITSVYVSGLPYSPECIPTPATVKDCFSVCCSSPGCTQTCITNLILQLSLPISPRTQEVLPFRSYKHFSHAL